MPFQKIQSEKLSSSVVRQIEQLILRGILRPGERLPPERQLSDRLGVSRPSLRDAVAELQDKGLLCTRAGAGVFVAEVLGSAFSPALTELFARHDEAVFDYLSFRRDIEALAAERAARLGTESDLAVIQFRHCANQSRSHQYHQSFAAMAEHWSDKHRPTGYLPEGLQVCFPAIHYRQRDLRYWQLLICRRRYYWLQRNLLRRCVVYCLHC